MMLNDCMYGIIFRDINPVRTFIDQRFSRQVHARAGIVINTGEDNYLTTADAVDAAHTVGGAQLLHEYFGREAGLADRPLRARHAVGVHPPATESLLPDRDLALESVRYVRRAAGRLGESFRPEPDGFVAQRARQVLGEAIELLRTIGSQGLLSAIGEGTFGVTRRPADGGRGLDGVVKQTEGSFNPPDQILAC